MFTVHRITPRFCQITDDIIGYAARAERTYLTEGLAVAIARRLDAAEYLAFGEDHFVVTAPGESPFGAPHCGCPSPVALDDEIPF